MVYLKVLACLVCVLVLAALEIGPRASHIRQALCYRATAPCLELNVPRREDKHKLPCLLSTMLGCSRKSADSHVEESPQEDPPVVTARAVGGEFMLLGQTF